MGELFSVGTLSAEKGTKVKGYVEVPGTSVKIPMTLICGETEGKTVVITGGTHGGEYPGVETAIRLAAQLDPANVKGRIALLHPVNVPAFFAKLQYVGPDDGKNLNREFPGKATGTVTQKIAYFVSSQLFTQADFYMDLHGGDIHEELTPFVIYSRLGDEKQNQLALEASKALGIKYVAGSTSDTGTFGCAAKMGVPGFLAEIGNLGLWSEAEVAQYMSGVTNVLTLLGVLDGTVKENAGAVVLDHMEGLNATKTGCWYPSVTVEEVVKKGQKIGEIRDCFGELLEEYTAPCDGTVLYVIRSLAINEGDPIIAFG